MEFDGFLLVFGEGRPCSLFFLFVLYRGALVNDKQENRNNDSNDGDPITVGNLLVCRLGFFHLGINQFNGFFRQAAFYTCQRFLYFFCRNFLSGFKFYDRKSLNAFQKANGSLTGHILVDRTVQLFCNRICKRCGQWNQIGIQHLMT